MEDGVSVFRCRTLRKKKAESTPTEMVSFLFCAARQLPHMLREAAYDAALVFFSIPCGPLGLMCRFLARVPYVVSLRGADVPGNEPSLEPMHRLLQPLRRTVLRNSQAIVANSEGLKKLSEQKDPFPVLVVPNGVDTDFFHPRGSTKDATFRFLFAGRFREQKNLFYLLNQMNRLVVSTREKFELHMVGDGHLKGDLVSYASSLPIGKRVSWHPWCDKDRLRDHFHHADCFVLTSLYEGMPNVVLEAMACGLPVIASRVIGNEELVKDGVTGLLFSLTGSHGVQEVLRATLRRKELMSRMGRVARAWIEERFSWRITAEAYLKIFVAPALAQISCRKK